MRKDAKFGISDKRGRASTTPDPYAADAALKEPALCRDCHALYRNKRWAIDPVAYGLAKNDRQICTLPKSYIDSLLLSI